MRQLVLILTVCISLPAFGQWDHSLLLMRDEVQRSSLQPAFNLSNTEDGFFIATGLNFRFEHSGKGLEGTWEVEDKVLKINTDKWVENLDPINKLNSDSEIQSFLIGWKTGNLTWTIGHSFRNQVYSKYEKGLAQFIHFGNGPYVGDTLNMGIGMDWQSYGSLHAGLSWKLKNLTVGARLHYLSGAQLLEIDPGELSLYTNEEVYQLQFTSDLNVRSASFLSAEDIDNLTFEFTGVESYQWFTRNHGFALDLGVEFQWSDRFVVEASILDMGAITWDEVQDYTTASEFEFEGIDFNEVADLDSLTFEEALDSLQDLAGVTESSESNVTRSLSPRLMLGAHWNITDQWQLSGIYMLQSHREEALPTYALGLRWTPFSWVTVGSNMAHRFDRLHWGMNISVQVAFARAFIATDHVPALFSLDELGSSSIRMGGALIF